MKKLTYCGLFVCLLAVSIGFTPTVFASGTPQNTEGGSSSGGGSIWSGQLKNPDGRTANDTKAIQGLGTQSSSLGGARKTSSSGGGAPASAPTAPSK